MVRLCYKGRRTDMKYSSTTPVLKRFVTSTSIVALAVMMTFSSTLPAQADEYDDRINAIQSQIGGYQAEAAALGQKADTLQTAVAGLQAQQNTVQAQINLSKAKYDQLITQIKETEEKIIKNQDVLGETISNLYVDNEVSPVEMLASSKSIGDFLDQQEYRSSVRDQVEGAIKEIKALKKSLEEKKVEVEQVLADQKSQKAVLASKQAEQANLLSQTRGNEAAYQNLIGAKNGEIENLREQQRAANARFIGEAGSGPACGGGYPGKWCNVPMDSTVDNWGMYNRQCVSYTAFKVAASGRHMPYWGGIGNANEWDDNARQQGIPVDGSPRAGDVAISNAGFYGHAMYVESVNGDGTINISQYNADWSGTYSTNTISARGLDFIHF